MNLTAVNEWAMGAQVPDTSAAAPVLPVCVGDQWHRFPSSFFLPGSRLRLQFVQSAFDGLLPRHFNASEVAPAAPPTTNLGHRKQMVWAPPCPGYPSATAPFPAPVHATISLRQAF